MHMLNLTDSGSWIRENVDDAGLLSLLNAAKLLAPLGIGQPVVDGYQTVDAFFVPRLTTNIISPTTVMPELWIARAVLAWACDGSFLLPQRGIMSILDVRARVPQLVLQSLALRDLGIMDDRIEPRGYVFHMREHDHVVMLMLTAWLNEWPFVLTSERSRHAVGYFPRLLRFVFDGVNAIEKHPATALASYLSVDRPSP